MGISIQCAPRVKLKLWMLNLSGFYEWLSVDYVLAYFSLIVSRLNVCIERALNLIQNFRILLECSVSTLY